MSKVIKYDTYDNNAQGKYRGVFVRVLKKNDLSFIIRYRRSNKTKDVVVGKKSEGITAKKAKDLLNDVYSAIRNGQNEELIIKNRDTKAVRTIIDPTKLGRMSLNKLAKLYFDMLKENAEKEKNLLKVDKTAKDENGIYKEENQYKNFWKDWGKSKVPFFKLTCSDFINQIKVLRDKTKTVTNKQTGETETVAAYSGKYISNAVILIKSIILHTNCQHNPLYISRKNEQPEDPQAEKELTSLYKTLIKNNNKNNAPRKNSYLKPEELPVFLNELKKNKAHSQGYIMALILLSTGMRPNSCLGLRIKDFDFDQKLISTFDFKRKEYYNCNLQINVEREILSYIQGRNDKNEYLFYSIHTQKKRPRPVLPDYIGDTMDRLFNEDRFGNDRIVPYSMRHTFATNLIKGVRNDDGSYKVYPTALLVVSKLLNHANIETTEKNYAHCTISDATNEINAYGSLLF
ncbi:MAG: site-specific integrase [Halarcobacter sp.]